jgi:recombination associated protein RdgC
MSLFKNAIAYRVTPGFKLDPEMLLRCSSRPCGPTESRTSGFASPCEHATDDLAHKVSGYTLICFETEDRLLPGSVVAEEVEARAETIEKEQGYRPGRHGLREIKEAVILELLPRAFTQKRRTYAVLTEQYFIIDTSSAARAQAVIECLGKALDMLPLTKLDTNRWITDAMIGWLRGETPQYLTVDDFVELEKEEDDKPTISYKRSCLDISDMRSKMADGYIPRKIGVTYNDLLSFRIDEDLHLKQLCALDLMMSQRTERDAQILCAADAFDADLTLITGEVVNTLNFIVDELGGFRGEEPALV